MSLQVTLQIVRDCDLAVPSVEMSMNLSSLACSGVAILEYQTLKLPRYVLINPHVHFVFFVN